MRPQSANTSARQPAVAGIFYPGDPQQLREAVSEYLRHGSSAALSAPAKALIVPHAGYVYSGTIAGQAYAQLRERRSTIRRVVLIGPSHWVCLRGAAVPRAEIFTTPLGLVPVDRDLKALLLKHAVVVESDAPHAMEHSLEVQLPFLQALLDEFTLLPVVLGSAAATQVAALLEAVWGEEETLVLASSDLSHYRRYDAAQQIDARTSAAIIRRQATLSDDDACGAVGINGMLHLARQLDLQVTQLARCNSGDTAGDRTRVVGYGAFALHSRWL